ncbi:hypothetical protein [Alkalicoccus daliensis]|uniref:Uncharacterized protein n=1 Tax=Alkalicoccus daliensis TaxID=745820 RepID=A0A1G9ZKL5_9BACI|nr:hypothetical protein [Alkalicoccus daliensis]SDN22042.1 hypothetical protein SAMN04488053_101152 [Alkalicoccus daliensis]
MKQNKFLITKEILLAQSECGDWEQKRTRTHPSGADDLIGF